MATKAPDGNIDESKLTVTKPKTKAVGIPAVANALKSRWNRWVRCAASRPCSL